MDDSPIFEKSGIAICVVDGSGQVVLRRGPKAEPCLAEPGTICRLAEAGACALGSIRDEMRGPGVHIMRGREIRNEFFDVVLIRTDEYCYSIAYPLASQRAKFLKSEAFEKLTAREKEIAGLMAVGLSNEAIKNRLGISPNTLRAHVKNIYRKVPDELKGQLQRLQLQP